MTVEVRVFRLPHGAGLPLPTYASPAAAGADLCAAVDAPLDVGAGQRVKIPTGLVLELPEGWEGQVRPRSGLAHRHGLTVANAPGTIDADYRGEVSVLLINLGSQTVTIERGDRVAQLIVAPVARARFIHIDSLTDTERGSGGFGSTGG